MPRDGLLAGHPPGEDDGVGYSQLVGKRDEPGPGDALADDRAPQVHAVGPGDRERLKERVEPLVADERGHRASPDAVGGEAEFRAPVGGGRRALEERRVDAVGDDVDARARHTAGGEVVGLNLGEDDDGVGRRGELGLLGAQELDSLAALGRLAQRRRAARDPRQLQLPAHLVDPRQTVPARDVLRDEGVGVVGGGVQDRRAELHDDGVERRGLCG